ncbi:MAG: hypothetical protein Q8R15_03325 [Candidatus Micrarchaeota archaeon]|nr:hypothetical protein [Candidatus Micrarchaeota archaeon]
MSSMQSAYLIVGGFAIVALFIHMEWLFYLMLLAFAALLVANSLSHSGSSHGSHSSHAGHSATKHQPVHAPPASFFDVLLANLIASKHTSIQDEHRRHKEHEEHKKERAEHEKHQKEEKATEKAEHKQERAEHEKHQKEEKAEEKKEHKQELQETREHLESQLKKIEEKIYNTNEDGKPPSVVNELQEQRKLLREKLDEVIRRL